MKNKILYRIIGATLIAFMLVFGIYIPTTFVFAKPTYAASESTFVNGNFTNPSSGSTNPYSPNNFTRVGANNDDVVSGIVFLDKDNFEKYNDSYHLPGTYSQYYDMGVTPNDANALLINNISSKNSYSAGYESDEFKFEANKYYRLSVYARTINKGLGSIVLAGNKNETAKTLYAKASVTSSGWNIYTFYVEADKQVDTTAKLGLWLGDNAGTESLGGVMFDSINLVELDAASYNAESKIDKNAVKVVSLATYQNQIDLIENGNFENGLTGWTISKDGSANARVQNVVNNSINDDGLILGDHNNSGSSVANNALVITSTNNDYATVTSNEFVVPQNESIEIRFYAKLAEGTNATVRLYSTEFKKNDTAVKYGDTKYEQTMTLSQTTDGKTNGYGLFKFLVVGNYYYDTVVKLDINFGSASSLTTGYVAIDDFSAFRLNGALQELCKAGKNVTTAQLYTGSVSSSTITNGFFNFVETVEYNENYSKLIYPLSDVTGFTKQTSNDNNSINGIIDTNGVHFAAHAASYGTTASENPKNPSELNNDNSITTSNNVLFMRNKSAGYTVYSSNDTNTIAKDTYVKISVDAYRNIVSGVIGDAYLRVVDTNNNEIARININEQSWQNKQIYISSGYVDGTQVKVELCLGTEKDPASGIVYFDNLDYSTSTAAEFSTAKEASANNKNIVVIELDNITFKNATTKHSAGGSLYNSVEFNLDASSSEYATVGEYKVAPSAVGNSTNSENGVLMFANSHYGISSITSNKGFNVDSSKYYKISVYAQVANVEAKASDLNDKTDYGVWFGLSNYTANANRIMNVKNTQNSLGNGIYNRFEFVIKPEEAETLNLVVGIGYKGSESEVNVSGTVYIDRICIETINASEFETYDNTTLNNGVYGVKIGTYSNETNNGNEDGTNPRSGFNWWYFSTIVLVITLVVVIAGIVIKKVDWSKVFAKKNESLADYDTRRIEHEQNILAKKEMRARKRAERKKNNTHKLK